MDEVKEFNRLLKRLGIQDEVKPGDFVTPPLIRVLDAIIDLIKYGKTNG